MQATLDESVDNIIEDMSPVSQGILKMIKQALTPKFLLSCSVKIWQIYWQVVDQMKTVKNGKLQWNMANVAMQYLGSFRLEQTS